MIPAAPRCVFPIALALAGCALPGCFAPQNNSNALGGSLTLSALTHDTRTGIRTAQVGVPDAPSLAPNSFARDHWAVARFSVPLDSPAHQPTYRPLTLASTDTLARQRGHYPTAESSLDLSTRGSAGQEIVEGFAAPLWAAFDLGLMPARALLTSPFNSDHAPDNPNRPRQRVPSAWSAAISLPPTPAPLPGEHAPDAAPLGPAAPPPAATPAISAPPAIPPGYWMFKDGRWIPSDQPPKP